MENWAVEMFFCAHIEWNALITIVGAKKFRVFHLVSWCVCVFKHKHTRTLDIEQDKRNEVGAKHFTENIFVNNILKNLVAMQHDFGNGMLGKTEYVTVRC